MIGIDRDRHPHLAMILDETQLAWPGHTKALTKSFARRDASDLDHAEYLSGLVLKLAPVFAENFSTLAEDYHFLCESIILPEEIHFRRNDAYRLSTFKEALDTVYNDHAYMTRYMNGLMLSCILWANHARALKHYATHFLTHLKNGDRLLEIGPGHGLLLSMACQTGALDVHAWDVSSASLDLARTAAETLGIGQAVTFRQQDIFEVPQSDVSDDQQFDAIVMSEVLEHLDSPQEALRSLFNLTRPGGRIWVNVPVNSPAPDHIYLLRTPDEARTLLSDAGFEVFEEGLFPMNDVDLDQAVRQKLTISCALVARRPV